ncbi:MAG TPA: hypothetical protein VGJ04_03795 [Pirellulales bacterium]|jgi:hypothetical protein
MQAMQFNDNWVIVDGFPETGGDVECATPEYSGVETSPDWFWTGKRWSSQSARCKLFASKRDAQSEMTKIRTSADS